MSTSLNSEVGAAGLFDSFSSMVECYHDDDGNPYGMYERVIAHETAHFLQHFFTPVGLSYGVIVNVVAENLEKLLRECNGPIKLPLWRWLRSAESPITSSEGKQTLNRIEKLLTQLDEGTRSAQQLARMAPYVAKLDLGASLDSESFRIEPESRWFSVGEVKLFEVDFAAICESMAMAIEIHAVASKWIEKGGKDRLPGLTAGELYDKVLVSFASECKNPQLLNYTFAFFLLLQNGYDFSEAVLITVIVSYIALFCQFPISSILEFDSAEIRRFATGASANFAKALRATCTSEFRAAFSKKDGHVTVIDYLDSIAAAAEVTRVSSSLKAFCRIAALLRVNEPNEGPQERWLDHVLDVAIDFVNTLNTKPVLDGLHLLMRPAAFMYAKSVGPLIVLRNQYKLMAENCDRLSDVVAYSYRLLFAKTLLFNTNVEPQWPNQWQVEEVKEAFSEYLRSLNVYVERVSGTSEARGRIASD